MKRLHNGWRIAAACMILLCLTAIFLFSTQDGNESSALSTQITAILLEAATGQAPSMDSAVFERANHIVRKTAHAVEYGLLAASCALFMHTLPLSFLTRNGVALGVCLIAASLDEYLQTLRAARNGTPVDVLIDMSGSVLALLLFALLWRQAVKGTERRVHNR